MPVKGERSHPLEGVKGAKKRLSKLPRAPEALDLQEQSSIYLRERNQMMRLKRMVGEAGGKRSVESRSPAKKAHAGLWAALFRPPGVVMA